MLHATISHKWARYTGCRTRARMPEVTNFCSMPPAFNSDKPYSCCLLKLPPDTRYSQIPTTKTPTAGTHIHNARYSPTYRHRIVISAITTHNAIQPGTISEYGS